MRGTGAFVVEFHKFAGELCVPCRLYLKEIFRMRTHCLTLDLQDDPTMIAAYKWYHKQENIWPGVVANIKSVGVLKEEIYLLGTRLVMILQTADDFSFEVKAAPDGADPQMAKWEALMWKYQKPLPQARPGEKWLLMKGIFQVG
jgi:L-rhamnose mutarotase